MAFAVRVWGLSSAGLWHDEALSHFYASQSVGWLLEHSAGQINHPPMFFLLLKAWISAGPTFSQFYVEFLNVLFGTATVAVVYKWCRTNLSRTLSLWVTLAVALNAFHVHYSSELRMYALATFALSTSGYFASKILKQESVGSINCLGLILGLLISVYTHSFTVIPAFVILIFLFYQLYNREHFRTYASFSLVFLLLYSPWGIYALRQGVRVSSDFWLPDFRFQYFGEMILMISGFVGPKKLTAYSLLISSVILVAFLIPLLLTILKWDKPDVIMMWAVVIIPVTLVVLMSLSGQSVFLHRIFLPLVPFIYVLWGLGINELPDGWPLILLASYCLILSAEVINLKENPPKTHVIRTANWIQNEYRENAVIVHDSPFSYFPSIFYHQRKLPEYLLTDSEHLRGISSKQVREFIDRVPVMVVYGGKRPKWIDNLAGSEITSIKSLNVGGREISYALIENDLGS